MCVNDHEKCRHTGEMVLDCKNSKNCECRDYDTKGCGCPVDYHLSDCPIFHPATFTDKVDYYDDYIEL